MTQYRIPFNKPGLVGRESSYMAECIDRGHAAGDGYFTRQCHTLLEEALGVPKALLTTSGTHALELAALLAGVGPGDEVILPTFTFVSTANAFVLRGAKPVFADIRPDTLNLDEQQIERLLSPRTRVIAPVHYAGVGCDMDFISKLAVDIGITVIEDNAHGLFARHNGRFLGTFGGLAALSFHETKNFHCGEAGALLINDPALIERAEILREKGTNRAAFFRGQTDKYTWVDIGSSYLPSDLLAAFLYAQLEARETVIAKRKRVWTFYMESLKGWAASHGVRLPRVPPTCLQSFHMFYLILPSLDIRDAMIAHLKARGILSVFHYVPLHLSRMGQQFGGRQGACPVAEDLSLRLLRLPFYNDLTEQEQSEVVQAIEKFQGWAKCAP
ncbi:MAG: dTDP-4-amino-4,6-dideoxygalactose transaminase [Bryobacterales bacterium]